jgi:hypothetical protein
LSQTIQFLSRSPPVAVVNGALQVKPPSVERLVTTALPCTPPASSRVSEDTSQALWAASYATDASVARSLGPAPAYLVIPGSRPLVQVAPLLVDVANPTAHAPPSKMRPTW